MSDDKMRGLSDFIAGAIDDFMKQGGGGIPNGFLYAVNYVNAEGRTCTEVGCMDDQSPVLSSGLNAHLEEVTKAWVQMSLFGCDCDCVDCDDCDDCR